MAWPSWFRGMMPVPYTDHSDLVLAGQFERGTFELNYVRDGGTVTPTKNGTPLTASTGIVGSCVNLENTGHDSLEWGAGGTVDGVTSILEIDIWFKTSYATTPAAVQEIVTLSDGATDNNRVSMYHTVLGDMYVQLYDSAGVQKFSGAVASWEPGASEWHNTVLWVDAVAGLSQWYMDGALFGTPTPGAYTRTGTADTLQIGKNKNSALANEFMADEILIWDAVKTTAAFTPIEEHRPLPTRPKVWPDWPTIYERTIPREWP